MSAITAASKADPAVLTSVGHGLSTGDVVTISGATGAWAAINGNWSVIYVSADTFSIAVDSTSFGTLAGSPIIGAASLISLQDVKTFLELDTTEFDVKLQAQIDAAVETAQDYCDRIFGVADYDPATDPDNALLDGKDLPWIWTPQWPIISVSALALVQEGNRGSLQTFAANQFAVYKVEGKISLTSAATVQLFGSAPLTRPSFPAGVQNVAVTYRAGYSAIPKSLAEALIITAAHFHLIGNTRRLGAKSISMTGGAGGGTSSFEIGDLPTEAQQILDRFKSVIPR